MEKGQGETMLMVLYIEQEKKQEKWVTILRVDKTCEPLKWVKFYYLHTLDFAIEGSYSFLK